MHRSTMHRYVMILLALGYLEQNSAPIPPSFAIARRIVTATDTHTAASCAR